MISGYDRVENIWKRESAGCEHFYISPFVLESLHHAGVTHSLLCHFETVPNSKKLQMTTEMWLLKDLKIT